jgi:hypothetical protein
MEEKEVNCIAYAIDRLANIIGGADVDEDISLELTGIMMDLILLARDKLDFTHPDGCGCVDCVGYQAFVERQARQARQA